MVPETAPAEALPPEPTPAPQNYHPDQRELMWEELTDTQKIERMRGVVKLLDEAVGRERTLRRKLVEQFVRHHHDAQGYPALPVREGELNHVESDFDSMPVRLSKPWI